jgi:hypothetical protein
VGCGRQILDGSAVNSHCMLPSQYAVDYDALLAAARAEAKRTRLLSYESSFYSNGAIYTQWYRNVLRNPQIRIDARGVEGEFRAMPITGAKAVKSVVEKFREKYGAKDVKKYYSTFDVGILVRLD